MNLSLGVWSLTFTKFERWSSVCQAWGWEGGAEWISSVPPGLWQLQCTADCDGGREEEERTAGTRGHKEKSGHRRVERTRPKDPWERQTSLSLSLLFIKKKRVWDMNHGAPSGRSITDTSLNNRTSADTFCSVPNLKYNCFYTRAAKLIIFKVDFLFFLSIIWSIKCHT